MTEPAFPNADPQLLVAARHTLADAGFRLRESNLAELPTVPWLLAENEYFLIAIAAGQALSDIKVLEGHLVVALDEVFATANLGPKRWDAYVVLMARADADERGSPDVLHLKHNTRSLRRIVALGVSEAEVEGALAPFISLPSPPPGGLPSAYAELVEQLTVQGIEGPRAQAAVDAFRSAPTAPDA